MLTIETHTALILVLAFLSGSGLVLKIFWTLLSKDVHDLRNRHDQDMKSVNERCLRELEGQTSIVSRLSVLESKHDALLVALSGVKTDVLREVENLTKLVTILKRDVNGNSHRNSNPPSTGL